ncbi:uncharacterized protein [Primulina eburnea]|uniref:uncharacterized protein isoform X1 n=1 Tax=Primulina eburnea TaxID=1245227 RepID=UPI003C6C29D8
MCQWISNNWSKKGSPRYIDILDASKSDKKIVMSILSPTDQEYIAPYIRNIFIEYSCTDSHFSYINSLLLEEKSVYCTKNPTLCESKETIQSKEEVHERKLCPKNKSKRSCKLCPAKKALEKQSHQFEPDDVIGKSDTSGYVKALQEHVDRNFVELKDMISNLDRKLERIMEVLNISSSSKRRLDEPTTVFAQSKKKKIHQKYKLSTTISNQGVTLGQEAVVEPLISPLTHLDNPDKEVTSINRDLNEGMSREEEVFDPLNNATHHLVGEPQKTSIIECGDKKDAHASLVGATDVGTMFVNDKSLPKEITPSLVVHKDARKSKKSQFCHSPMYSYPRHLLWQHLVIPVLTMVHLNRCNVFPLRKYCQMLLKK